MIQAEVPNGSDPSSDQVGNQIIQSNSMQRNKREPVDEQSTGVDRSVHQGPMQDATIRPRSCHVHRSFKANVTIIDRKIAIGDARTTARPARSTNAKRTPWLTPRPTLRQEGISEIGE